MRLTETARKRIARMALGCSSRTLVKGETLMVHTGLTRIVAGRLLSVERDSFTKTARIVETVVDTRLDDELFLSGEARLVLARAEAVKAARKLLAEQARRVLIGYIVIDGMEQGAG